MAQTTSSRRAAAVAAAATEADHAVQAEPRTRRGLRIDQFARGHAGVWFYQIDVDIRSVCPHPQASTKTHTLLEACVEDDVQCYSVRRRYTEFLQLYEKIKDHLASLPDSRLQAPGDQCELPPFPQKEYISSSVLGLLWRGSSPSVVLEDRRAKFEALLCWLEDHPVLRNSLAFVDFLGQPPQHSEGYVSLKEYTSQNWLSSLQKLTKEKEKRRRRTSSDCSSCSVLQQEQTRRTKKRRQEDASTLASSLAWHKGPMKRQRRQTPEPKSPVTKTPTRLRNKKRSSSSLDEKTELCIPPSPHNQLILHDRTEPNWAAHMESIPLHKKTKHV